MSDTLVSALHREQGVGLDKASVFNIDVKITVTVFSSWNRVYYNSLEGKTIQPQQKKKDCDSKDSEKRLFLLVLCSL